jgi:DNA-binding beta-propeller fold protein YncE
MRRLVGSVLACALAVGVPLSGQARAAMVVGTWPVGRAPLSVATDAATGKIYVANSETAMADGTGRISVVDPASGSVSSLVTSLTANFVLIDGRSLYSSNATYAADQTSVDVIDLDSGARITIPGVGGLSLGIDAGAGRLFAGGRVLSVIDTASHETKRTLPAPPSSAWFGVAVDPGARRVYLSNPSSRELFAYDYNEADELTAAWTSPLVLPTAVRYALAVDPVGHRVFAAGSDTSGGGTPSAFYVIDASGTVVDSTPIVGFPSGIALAPSAHRIYVATMTSQAARGAIYALSDAYDLTETVETPFAPGQPLLHADGRLYVGNYVTVGDYNRFWAPDSTLKALDMANHAPVVTVTLDPANPRTDQTVSAIVDAHDPDLRPMGAPDPTTRTYEWLRNGTIISGQTGSALDLKLAGNGDHGDQITVRVTASDGQLTSTATQSVDVVNTAPTSTVSLSPASPKTNDVLVATTNASDADGDALSYTYTWTVNGAVKRTATASSTDRLDLKVKGNGDKGDVVTVIVTVSDGAGGSITASASATVR